jgi:hypothetical protein
MTELAPLRTPLHTLVKIDKIVVGHRFSTIGDMVKASGPGLSPLGSGRTAEIRNREINLRNELSRL